MTELLTRTTLPRNPPGQEVGSGGSPVMVSGLLKGLQPATRYEVRFKAQNNEGQVSEPSEVAMFVTEGNAPVELEAGGKPLAVSAKVELVGNGARSGSCQTGKSRNAPAISNTRRAGRRK